MLLKRVISFLKYLFIFLVLLLVLILGGVNLPIAQRFITDKANKVFIENKLPVHVDRIKFFINGRLGLSGVRIEKSPGDTIVNVGEIKVSVKVIPLIFHKIKLAGVNIDNATINIGTDPATGNLDIVSIFSSGNKSSAPKSGTGKEWEISIGSVYLNNVRFTMNDTVNGIHIDQTVKELTATFEKFSMSERKIFASYISIKNADGGITLGVSQKTPADSSTTGAAWAFKLNESDFDDIHFTFSQPANTQKMDFYIGKGSVSRAALDLGKYNIRVGKLLVAGPVIQIYSTSDPAENEAVKPDKTEFNFPGSWKVTGDDIRISDGIFQTGPYPTDAGPKTADSAFKVTELNSNFSAIMISSGSSHFKLDELAFVLDNGFRLVKGEVTFNSDSTLKTTLKSKLSTPFSNIDLSLEADTGISGMISSYLSVPFSLKIYSSEVSAGDLLYFIPELAKNKTYTERKDLRLTLNGDISGNADRMQIKFIDLKTSKGASLSLSGDIEGIIDPSSAKCSVRFKTGPVTPSHLRELLSLTSSSVIIPDFDPFSIEGSVDSTLTKPRFHIALESNSARLIMDGNFDTDNKSYSLKMSASDIDLGKYSGINDLGRFTGTLNASGKEFDPARMRLIASIQVDTAYYKGYNYKNIRADLNGENGSFNYTLKADDPSFTCDLTGTVIMSDSLTGGQIKGMLALDAEKVNIYKGASVTGFLEAGLKKTPAGLSGFATIKDMTLRKGNNSRLLKNLDMSFGSSDTLVKGQITSDFLRADGYYQGSVADIRRVFHEGRFRGIALLDSAVGNRLPYITLMSGMHLSLESSYHPLIGLLVSDTIFSYNKVTLKIDNDSSDLAKAEISVDRFKIGKTRGFNALVTLGRHKDRSELEINADSLRFGNISLSGLSAAIKSGGDTAIISLKALGRGENPLFDIEGKIYKSGSEIKMTTSSDQWVINGFTWKVTPGDFLIKDSRGKDIQADLHLKNDLSTIDIYGRSSEMISFEFSKLGLSMLLVPGMNNLGYDCEFTGKIDYTGGTKTDIVARMDIDRIRMNEDNLGNMKITGRYQSDTLGNIEGSVDASMNDSSVVKLDLKYGKKPDQRSFNAEFNHLPLIIIGSLSAQYISDLQGTIGGRINLKPVNGKPLIEGEIRVNNTGLKLVPVNARFYMPGDVIKITDNKLLFSNFTVLDSLHNKLDLNGSINLSDPRNIIADLHVTTNRIQVMNTTSKDNPEFNGSIFVNSRINLSGSLQKPVLQGSIILDEGTVINYRYTEDLAVSETQKIVTFASLTEDLTKDEKKKIEISGISRSPDIEATLEINPNTLFNFEISKGYDIGVHITGGGFLTYSMTPGKAINLTGMYEIREGSSELKIPGWPRKDFTITPGSNVKWDGQVDDPDLRIETTSKVRGSYVNPIDQKNREVNFIVYMKLAGRLSQIDILFDVRSEDQYLTSVFNSMSADERMRQAINLLIFGSVQLPNATGSSDYMTQQINQFWESQINSFTRSAVKFVDFSLGIDSYKDPAKAGADRTSVSYKVKKDLFKDRGSVMVSGRMNDNDPSSQQSNAVIENFIFEYALNTDRTNYLKVYRQQNYEDLLEGEVIKSGVGFIYRKNYDRVSDIWRRENKPKGKK